MTDNLLIKLTDKRPWLSSPQVLVLSMTFQPHDTETAGDTEAFIHC